MKQRGMFVWGRRVKRFCGLQRELSCRRTPFPSRGTWQSETARSPLMQALRRAVRVHAARVAAAAIPARVQTAAQGETARPAQEGDELSDPRLVVTLYICTTCRPQLPNLAREGTFVTNQHGNKKRNSRQHTAGWKRCSPQLFRRAAGRRRSTAAEASGRSEGLNDHVGARHVRVEEHQWW